MYWQILALFAMGGLLMILRIWMIVLEEREAFLSRTETKE